MIQLCRFTTGGYVLHNIRGDWKGRISAWFDQNGKLTDAEQLLECRETPIKRNGPIWQQLQRIGAPYQLYESQ